MGHLRVKNDKKPELSVITRITKHIELIDIFCCQLLSVQRFNRLLNRYTWKRVSWVRIPSPPPAFAASQLRLTCSLTPRL